jgi:hypothetical protein
MSNSKAPSLCINYRDPDGVVFSKSFIFSMPAASYMEIEDKAFELMDLYGGYNMAVTARLHNADGPRVPRFEIVDDDSEDPEAATA